MILHDDPLCTLHLGDCVEVMRELPAESVDAVVTDPPYGLEFMGKEWDRLGVAAGATSSGWKPPSGSTPGQDGLGGEQVPGGNPARLKGDVRQPGDPTFHKSGSGPHDRSTVRYGYGMSMAPMQSWHEAWAREAFRVAKPGAHLLAFGGTRTYHRLASATDCTPEPASQWAPAGYVCPPMYGIGTASTWPGPGAAANWCSHALRDSVGCGLVTVRSLDTSVTITVALTEWCMCWVGVTGPAGETARLIDLDPGMVLALHLDPSDGLFRVEVWPAGTMPDSAMAAD